MERLAELISKLKEQFEQKADSSKLLATTLLIERELMKLESAQGAPAKQASAPVAEMPRSSKVSVVMPSAHQAYQPRAQETMVEEVPEVRYQPKPQPQPVIEKPQPPKKPQ